MRQETQAHDICDGHDVRQRRRILGGGRGRSRARASSKKRFLFRGRLSTMAGTRVRSRFMKRFLPLLCAALSALALPSPAAPVNIETDVVVFGGTAGGVAAACTAVRLGKKAVVTEYGTHIGGLTSGGLGWTDIGNKAAIGGFSRDFYKVLGKHYKKDEAWAF